MTCALFFLASPNTSSNTKSDEYESVTKNMKNLFSSLVE